MSAAPAAGGGGEPTKAMCRRERVRQRSAAALEDEADEALCRRGWAGESGAARPTGPLLGAPAPSPAAMSDTSLPQVFTIVTR